MRMGMITRVRARLQSVSPAQKLDVKHQQDDRNTKTMCVLSVILLVPCFARLPSTFLFCSVAAAYCVVVLPLLISGLCRRRIIVLFCSYLNIARGAAISKVKKTYAALQIFLQAKHRLEMGFLKTGNISNLLNQILFFAMCDRFFCPDQILTCLYSLMFYNVIAYCIEYAHRILTKTNWSPYVHISQTTNVQHLAMTTTKLVLELTKAVTFIITAIFMLLVFGLEQGLQHYHPTWPHIYVTACYYVVTENTTTKKIHWILEKMKLEGLEGLEKLWAPVILKATVCILSAIVCVPLLFTGFYSFSLIGFYVNVFLSYKDFVSSSWTPLKQECAALAKYRYATQEELRDADDVCAVCLQPMRFARFTPCHHMFHSDCLRLCMKASTACPMCKQEL